MSSLLVAFVLCFTTLTVVSLGIVMAYAAVTGILYALAPHSDDRSHPAVLVPSQGHASGD